MRAVARTHADAAAPPQRFDTSSVGEELSYSWKVQKKRKEKKRTALKEDGYACPREQVGRGE